jgi:hypothetical protein
VRQKLLNRSRRTGENFQLLLGQYAAERLLSRLAESEHAGRFVLKGAVLFAVWTGEMHRPTRDLDLLGFGENTAAALAEVFRSLCQVAACDDGLDFLPDTITAGPIREDQEYGGQRIRLEARLGNARIGLQVDVGFGDAITPRPEIISYPTLLGMPAPRLRAYPRETVVAEKLQAMVQLGMTNSRMKDFYDLHLMAQTFPFSGPTLREAIAATFARRTTEIPNGVSIALTDTFAKDDMKGKQWAAFLKRNELAEKARELLQVVEDLAAFLIPPMTAARGGEDFPQTWKPGGPWDIKG